MIEDMNSAPTLALSPTHTTVPVESPPPVVMTQPTLAQLTDQAGFVRAAVGDLQGRIDEVHQRLRGALLAARAERLRESPTRILEELADLGFAWRQIAALIGVSVPAVQKWRKGERLSPENLDRLATLAATCDLVSTSFMIGDVASWFDIRILPEIPVRPIDLYAAGRLELLLDWAGHHETDPEALLTRFDSDWRERYRTDFEVFQSHDGELGLRLKER